MHVGDQIVVEIRRVTSDHRSEEKPAETGRRVARQHHVSEGQSSSRSERARVPDLEFGEQDARRAADP